MTPENTWIVVGVFTALLALVFWVLKYQITYHQNSIDYNRQRIEEMQNKVQHLEELLWSEGKLTKVIKDTVKATMNEILVAWYESGKMGRNQ